MSCLDESSTRRFGGMAKKNEGGDVSYLKQEQIVCPNCERIQEATVTFDESMPFPSYVHECECGYIITESEWEVGNECL